MFRVCKVFDSVILYVVILHSQVALTLEWIGSKGKGGMTTSGWVACMASMVKWFELGLRKVGQQRLGRYVKWVSGWMIVWNFLGARRIQGSLTETVFGVLRDQPILGPREAFLHCPGYYLSTFHEKWQKPNKNQLTSSKNQLRDFIILWKQEV